MWKLVCTTYVPVAMSSLLPPAVPFPTRITPHAQHTLHNTAHQVQQNPSQTLLQQRLFICAWSLLWSVRFAAICWHRKQWPMKCIKTALQKCCNTTIEVDWFNEMMGNVRWVRLVVTASGDGFKPPDITVTTSSEVIYRATHTARRTQQSQSSTHNTALHKWYKPAVKQKCTNTYCTYWLY